MGSSKIGRIANRSEFESELDRNIDEHKSNGCFVSTKKAIVLAVFAVLSLAAVGAIIYFYGAKYNKNQDETNDLEVLLNNSLSSIKFEDFRLPTDVLPTHYRLRIHPYLNETDSNNFRFFGEVTILLHCITPTKTITLHSDELEIVKPEVKVSTRKDSFLKVPLQKSPELNEEINNITNSFGAGDDGPFLTYTVPKTTYLKIQHHEEEKKMSRYIIHLSSDLESNKNYTLDIKFSGQISNNLLGLYRTSYLGADGNKRWILNTHLQPIFARRVIPCFDEPSFKASFEVSIARKTSMSSVSNMPLKESEKIQHLPGWVWDHFETSPPMSPHLLAFTVFDYDYITPNSTDIGAVIKLWAPKHLLANAHYAVNIGPKILHYLQNYFGIKFPLSKVDLVAIPELYQMAMENWGLITFRENALLLDSSSNSWETRNYIFKTVIGKLTKQWFGNSVTPEWWSDIWLSEGFSTYMEDLVENSLDPALKDLDIFSMRIIQSILDSDKLRSVQSLQVEIKDPTQIEQLFDDVAYNKGSCLIRMLNCTISEATFKRGIHNYLKTKMFGSTSIDDFWNSFANINANTSMIPHGVSIKQFMDTWITQDGYPVLTVTRNYEDGSALINQKGFVNFHKTNNYLWHIPLMYAQEETDVIKHLWMKNEKSLLVENFTVPNTTKWILFKVEGTGVYRVNYDKTNWDLLQKQLRTDYSKISPTNRGQLLNDAIELSNIGMLNYSTAFELAQYLKHNEDNLVPWHSFFNSLKSTMYIMQRTEYFGIFEDYIISLIKPTYEKLGHIELPNESKNNQLLRNFIIKKACEYNYKPCLDWSKLQFQTWMKSADPDKTIPIPFGHRDAAICTAIKTGGKEEWDFLWERTLHPFVSRANLKLFYSSLGCTRQHWLINRFLERTLNGTIALQNTKIVWKSLVHPVGLSVGFTYLRANWKKIYKKSEHLFGNLNTIFEEFLSKLSTKIDLEDLTLFFKNNKKELLPVSSLILSLVEKLKWRINWIEVNLKTVAGWIVQNIH